MLNPGQAQLQAVFNTHPTLMQNLFSKKVTLGFDGFIDSIVKIIRHKNEDSKSTYFETSSDFAHYILEKESNNFSVELEELTNKIGGNMAIMSNALALLGPELTCIGTFGFPQVHRAFQQMPGNCTLYSFAEPGLTTALEFKDSKILMAEMKGINQVNWKTVKDIVGEEKVIELFSGRHLISLLNWSELENSTDIWKGLLTDILPKTASLKKKAIGFFDLSDCSRKSPAKIRVALDLLKEFCAFWEVTLSLNLNEANVLYSALGTKGKTAGSVHGIGDTIYRTLGISKVVIHYSTEAFCWDYNGIHHSPTVIVSEPKVLTGAGDNFNAGFCAGLLLDLDIDLALQLGHSVSGYYLRQGESPNLHQLISSISATK